MDKFDKAVFLTAFVFILVMVIIALDSASIPETERTIYKDNMVINDMSIETYNKSYDELTYEQKEQMIRWYRISEHTGKDYRPVPFIVPVPL